MTDTTGAQTPPDGAADAGAANAGGAGTQTHPVEGEGNQAGTPDPKEMIPRSELHAVVKQRDEAKVEIRTLAARLQTLEMSFGGKLPSGEEIEDLRTARSEAEAARREKMIAEGKIDELVTEARADMQQLLQESTKKCDGLMAMLKTEKAGRLASSLLVKADVMGTAAAQAAAAMLNPADDNVRIDLRPHATSGELQPVLVDDNMNGVWPLNAEGGNMSFDEFTARFVAKNPFYFRSSIAPGTGRSGPDGQTLPSDQTSTDALRKRWEEEGDMEAYNEWKVAEAKQTSSLG